MKISTKNFGNTVDPAWRKWSRSIRFFLGGIITLMAGASFFEPKTALIIIFILGVALLAVQSIDIAAGLPPETVINQQAEKLDKTQQEENKKVIDAANS